MHCNHNTKECGEREVERYAFFTAPLCGDKLSAFHRGLFIHGERDPGTFCVGVGGPHSVPGYVG
jgi:hypothetical protein